MIFVKNYISNLLQLLIRPLLSCSKMTTKNVLYVNLSLPLGDFVSRIKTINSLRPLDHDSVMYLVCDNRFHNLERYFNESIKILYINTKLYKYNPIYRIEVLNKIRNLDLKLTINLSVDRGMISDEITLLSGALAKVGVFKKNLFLSYRFEKINNSLYTHLFQPISKNEYEQMDEMKDYLIANHLFESIYNTPAEKKSQKGLKKNIVIAPFSSRNFQSWPIHNYLALSKFLNTEARVTWIGIPIVKNQNTPKGIVNETGAKNLDKLFGLIKEADLFIGNDSGLSHIAMFFDVPAIILLGGGAFGQFFPNKLSKQNVFLYEELECFNCLWKCVHLSNICLTRISVESVLKTVKARLYENTSSLS